MWWFVFTLPLLVTVPPQKSFHCCLLKKKHEKKTKNNVGHFVFPLKNKSLEKKTYLIKYIKKYLLVSGTNRWLNVTVLNKNETYYILETYQMTGHWTQMCCVDHFWLDSETLRSCHPAGVVLSLWEMWHSYSLTCHTDTSYCKQKSTLRSQGKHTHQHCLLKPYL